jgi:hypothetical protein
VVAQEKWEYAVILYNASNGTINTSITGQTFTEEKIEKKTVNGLGDRTPVLRKVDEMIKAGWEVLQYSDYGLSVYMRKKKQ